MVLHLFNGAFVPAGTKVPAHLVYFVTQDNDAKLIVHEANALACTGRTKPKDVECPDFVPLYVAGEWRVPHLPKKISVCKPGGDEQWYYITTHTDHSKTKTYGRPGDKEVLNSLGNTSSKSCVTVPTAHYTDSPMAPYTHSTTHSLLVSPTNSTRMSRMNSF